MRQAIRMLGIRLLATAVLLAGATAGAQEMPEHQILLGPRAGLDVNDGTHLVLGGEARFSVLMIAPSVRLDIRPEFNFYVFSGGHAFDISGDALFAFGVHNPTFEPYAGAGVGIFNVSDGTSDTRVGLNLLGGCKFLAGSPIQPFAEIRFTVGDFNPILLMGGVLFVLH